MDKLLDDIEHKRSKRNEKSKRQRLITNIFYIISKPILIKNRSLVLLIEVLNSHTLTFRVGIEKLINSYD